MEVGIPAATAQDTTGYSPDDDPRLPGMMEVHVSSAGEADLALDRAVAVIAEAAKHHRTGVLVTRIGAGHYIVRAHPAVPYGLVRESMMAPKLGVGPDESNEILKQASIFLERELGPRGP